VHGKTVAAQNHLVRLILKQFQQKPIFVENFLNIVGETALHRTAYRMQQTLFPVDFILPLRISKKQLRNLIGGDAAICHKTLTKQLFEDGIYTKENWPKLATMQLLPVHVTLKIYEVYKIKTVKPA